MTSVFQCRETVYPTKRFADSMFELVDIWTETTEEQEYLDLLSLITNGITKVIIPSDLSRISKTDYIFPIGECEPKKAGKSQEIFLATYRKCMWGHTTHQKR